LSVQVAGNTEVKVEYWPFLKYWLP